MATHSVRYDEQAGDAQQLGRRITDTLQAAGMRTLKRSRVGVSKRTLSATITFSFAELVQLLEWAHERMDHGD